MNKVLSRVLCFSLGLVSGVALVVSTTPYTGEVCIDKDLDSYMPFEDRLESLLTEEERRDYRPYLPVTGEFSDFVSNVCDYYKFDDSLIYKMIYVESRFQTAADSGTCKGLMQVNENYADHYAKIDDGLLDTVNYDLLDPYDNVVIGVRVLNDWRDYATKNEYSRTYDWLCFYNMGYLYKESGSNGYAETVMSTDLSSIDFSDYEVVG